VREYLGALGRGDRASAQALLAKGSPGETFVDANAHVESVRSESTGSGTYKVYADVHSTAGEYYITFSLQPGAGGLQIFDHYAIKTGP
jgi:hypothetical protein